MVWVEGASVNVRWVGAVHVVQPRALELGFRLGPADGSPLTFVQEHKVCA